jgi:lactoylglutathione lyase
VLVGGREADLIRSSETARDVQRRDRVPGRLRGGGSRVLGVDHVSVAVADIDCSLGFYRDLLGLTVRERGVLDPGLVERMTGVPDAEVEYADVELGSRVLELLHFRAAQPQRPASQRLPGAGGMHIGLRVEDATAVHERLTAGGFEPLSAPVLLPEDGTDWSGGRVFYVRDPDGATIEIVERAAEHAVPVPAVVDASRAVHRR